MGQLRRSVPGLIIVLTALVACTLPPLATPTPRPTPSPTPSPTAEPSGTASPTPTAEPEADPRVPLFAPGELIETATDGLRVRQRPSQTSVVVAGLLPFGAQLEVVMGPLPVDEFSWYLVADADDAEPAFGEGWIAAGYEPDPFLRATGRTSESRGIVAGYALTGNAEHGPIEIDDEHHAIRWIAVDPERRRCTFAVLLATPDGEPTTAIRATIGNDVVPGTLQPTFFASQPELRGHLFVSVESDCAWALVVVRVPPPDDEASDG